MPNPNGQGPQDQTISVGTYFDEATGRTVVALRIGPAMMHLQPDQATAMATNMLTSADRAHAETELYRQCVDAGMVLPDVLAFVTSWREKMTGPPPPPERSSRLIIPS